MTYERSCNRHLMLAQVKQRHERRIVGANSGIPDGIMGGVGLQGHAMFSTRRDLNVQVCGCQPEMIIDCAAPRNFHSLLQEGAPNPVGAGDSSNVLHSVLEKHSLFSCQLSKAITLPLLEWQGMMDIPMMYNSLLASNRPAPVPNHTTCLDNLNMVWQ